ncbi:hypothetical protein HMPREF9083_1052 [Dialister micraerophilus DSM 19965]|uniref:Uncharacterized protein n=1 Tax=Dialister micraerophilus DSM 19965 TaxID=888062 RepID=F2BXY8_9FIRM|nr:hypothetical protein HMPREF9083_1052 [Dialister micraerophilus DSM 19965]
MTGSDKASGFCMPLIVKSSATLRLFVVCSQYYIVFVIRNLPCIL